jgi:hypothetical protein
VFFIFVIDLYLSCLFDFVDVSSRTSFLSVGISELQASCRSSR